MRGADETAAVAANRAIIQGAFEEAEALAVAAIGVGQDGTAMRVAYATALAKQLRFEEAVEQCLPILGHQDAEWLERLSAIRVMACCATQLGEPDRVRPHIDAMGFENTTHPIQRSWRPRILARLGATEEAHREIAALAAEFPGYPLITVVLGQVMQELGDAEGLPLEMTMMGQAFHREFYGSYPPPERIWEGEPLEGRSLAIVPRGGFGDLFACIRYAEDLKGLGAGHVTVAAGMTCRGLVLSSAGVDEVVDFTEADAAIGRSDLWVPIPGLKWVATLSKETTWPGGYLEAPESAAAVPIVRAIRERAAGRPCIALYWHSDRDLGEHKSVPLQALGPLLARDDLHWVILQRGFGLRQFTASGLGAGVSLLGEDLSFDDTAAVMAQLDGCVSICAWAFNLAGALGLRTWLLAGRVMDCRHLNRERESVVFADCASLARQPRIGDWPGAVARLGAELDAFTSAWRVGRGEPTEGESL